MDLQPLTPDEQIERVRAVFEEINRIPPPERMGFGKFFHNLAKRMGQPKRKVIMKRVKEAEPPTKSVTGPF